jgi:hypothetical protein
MLQWMLIYVMIESSGVAHAINAYGLNHRFDSMYDCFNAREQLSQDVGGINGHFPPSHQAVCVRVKK